MSVELSGNNLNHGSRHGKRVVTQRVHKYYSHVSNEEVTESTFEAINRVQD
jgi:hypothetical protein